MKRPDIDDSIYELASDAVDEEELAELLEAVAGERCDDEAVAALHAVAVDTLLADVLAAAAHGRWRGGGVTGEAVGEAAERRRSCCEGDEVQGMRPLSAKWEWGIE